MELTMTSTKTSSALVLFSIIGLGIIVSTNEFHSNLEDSRNYLASAKIEQPGQLKIFPQAKNTVLKVGQGAIARIDINEGLSIFSDRMRLTGHIELFVPADTLHLKWELPEGVQIVSGSTELDLINPDSVIEVPLEVLVDKNANRQLHLSVSASSGSIQLGTIAQLNTDVDTESTGRLPASAESDGSYGVALDEHGSEPSGGHSHVETRPNDPSPIHF